ncbi:MAG: PD40 domain-containing protein [Chromatiales bacterium]|nr:PD40 domain-containing protein [Chromatiales bacterium]
MIRSLATAALVFFSGIAPAAEPFEQCGSTELLRASTPFSFIPSTNEDGTLTVFYSTADFTGGNPNGDFQAFFHNTVTAQIVQLTGGVVPVIAAPSTQNAFTADGTLLAYASNANPTGGNPDGNTEIFLYNTVLESHTQLTSTTGSINGFPALSDDGTTVAFFSTGDFLGTNADGNAEIFILAIGAGTIKQATNVAGSHLSSAPTINAAGTAIAFTSSADLTGGNPDGNTELFFQHTATLLTTQVTSTVGFESNDSPQMDDLGNTVVFTSSANLVPPGNIDGNTEIFLWENGVGFTQVTATTGGETDAPTISGDGTRVGFVSDRDLVGSNADGNQEIFYWSSISGATGQATDSAGDLLLGNDFPAYSGDGEHIVFASDADFSAMPPMGVFLFGSIQNAEILRFDHMGGGIVALTDTPTNLLAAVSLSGDGLRLAFDGVLEMFPPPVNRLQLYEGPVASLSTSQRIVTDGASFIFFVPQAAANSTDGSQVMFASTGDPAGNNADGSLEAFVYDATGPTFIQLTDAGAVTDQFAAPTSISGDGMRITILSSADLTGFNADNSVELFLFDRGTNTLTQITSGSAGLGTSPAFISRDGSRIAMISNTNPSGTNPDLSMEIFVYDIASTTFTQLTSNPTDIQDLAINADGSRVASTSIDDLTGQNADGNREVFVFNVPGPGVTQITQTTSGENTGPVINGDGSRIAFLSNADLPGIVHGTENDVIRYDLATGVFRQYSSPGDTSRSSPSIDAAGDKVAYIEGGALALFSFEASVRLGQCVTIDPKDVPTTSTMTLWLSLLTLAVVGLVALRSRKRLS